MFLKMRPLLGASMTSGEVKKRDEKINVLQSQVAQQAQEKQKIEEDRRRAESDLQKVQKVLESERSLALDKEEIFRRLQQREVELNEKLSGALDDQETLEEQLDELIAAKRRLEDEVEQWRKQAETGGEVVFKLEHDKKELLQQISSLESQIRYAQQEGQDKTRERESLTQELKALKSNLILKERKLLDAEKQLAKVDADLEEKLLQATKQLNLAQKQVKELSNENSQARMQLRELSSTSAGYEDLVRRKETEIAILKADLQKAEVEHKVFEDEKKSLRNKQSDALSSLRMAQAEAESLEQRRRQLEREAIETKKLLEAKVSEDEKLSESRRLIDDQMSTFKSQVETLQLQLATERKSKSDSVLESEQQLSSLQREHEALNAAKITIEKEMYAQQDHLRRASEAQAQAEKEKRQTQSEIRDLRTRLAELEMAKTEAETKIERCLSRQAMDMKSSIAKEREKHATEIAAVESEKVKLVDEVKHFKKILSDSESYRSGYDSEKKRLQQQLDTARSRLLASENDNKVLLGRVQTKNLEISRSNSRAGDNFRSKLVSANADKTRAEEEEKRLRKQLGDAQIHVSSLQKQKEKLSLNVEDLNHEVSREKKAARNAEKLTSQVQLQFAEANRALESDRQLKAQTQANNRKLQQTVDELNGELNDCRHQLLVLQKVFDPDATAPRVTANWETGRNSITRSVNLAQKLEEAQQAVRVSEERLSRAESQLSEVRKKHRDEILELEGQHANTRRSFLEEMGSNTVPPHGSPGRADQTRTPLHGYVTPTRRHARELSAATSGGTYDSGKSDKTVDTIAYQKRMDLVSELDLISNQNQLLEMQNRHLQSQLEKLSPTKNDFDDSPSLRRIHRLERENDRLHDMLDSSTEQLSALERTVRSGEFSIRDIQSRTHEELYDMLNSQEQSRRNLLAVHNATVADLSDAKSMIDKLRLARNSLEQQCREVRTDLDEVSMTADQDKASRSQLLAEFADLQIRLDSEASKVTDLEQSMQLYKGRAEEYFSKLEQAEMAVLKAARSEQFARSQCREAEETCTSVLSERRQNEALVEDLQRQTQSLEEKVEDLSADLSAATQAKRRLQHEVEDYRSRRTLDIEDKESSMEQTRKKYQSELSSLSHELEAERTSVVHAKEDNRRLREEIDDLRAKWDDEVLNSSTWAKEKARLEFQMQNLSNSREEVVQAHQESQNRVSSLLSQLRTLRNSADEIVSERDQLQKEKRTLEQRLNEASERLEELARGESPSLRNAAGLDRQILDIKTQLAQQQDISAAAIEKMRRAEALVAETQKDIGAEREMNVALHKEKAQLEKTVKDSKLRLVDLETKSYSTGASDVKFFQERIQELERQLESEEEARNKRERSTRNIDRTVRDLQNQIDRRDRSNSQLQDEISKGKEKIDRLLQTVNEIQVTESEHQLHRRRAEREAMEERERRLRLERELEGWKGLRLDRSHTRSTTLDSDDLDNITSSRRGSRDYNTLPQNIPQRKSSKQKSKHDPPSDERADSFL